MAVRITDIGSVITGVELSNLISRTYIVIDDSDTNGITYKMDSTEFIDYIVTKGKLLNYLGDVVTKNIGYGSGKVLINGTNIYSGAVLTSGIGDGKIYPLIKNDAFNKSFALSNAINGASSIVARADHTHTLLASFSNENNLHTAQFNIVDTSSFSITLGMLLSKMKYAPTLAISPIINYKIFQYTGGELIPSDIGDYGLTVTSVVNETVNDGNWRKFSSFDLPSLNITKRYLVVVLFIDNRGIFIPTSGVVS